MSAALLLSAHGAAALTVASVPRTAAAGAARSAVVMAAGDPALIIQNKGGGHGDVPRQPASHTAATSAGYHLALELANGQGRPVTILHEGKGPNAKEAHRAYGDLDAAGVQVLWCDDLTNAPECLAKLGGATFGSVVDNWSKSPEDIQPYAQAAKDWGVSTFAYVSSAGMWVFLFRPVFFSLGLFSFVHGRLRLLRRRAPAPTAQHTHPPQVQPRQGRLQPNHRGMPGQIDGAAAGGREAGRDGAAVDLLP
eukprot:scaffold6752_cov92-Isochrysis_galbana.AAC.4